jgi:steroid delta-isomerase-like uncharacterized protein
MSAESTREVMEKYFRSEHGDVSMMADDVVFTDMNTGQESKGPEGVLAMLNWIYHQAFSATAETTNVMYTDGHALIEGYFVGRHTGEFAGIPATGRDVRVPICVTYDLENDKIKRARIYLAAGALMQQLGVGG